MDLDACDDPYDPLKVCPECGGEYRYTASVCADCEVPLVLPDEIAERDARELRLSPRLVLLRTAPIQWIRALAADLAQAGMSYAIDRRKARSDRLLSLYVQREDRKVAVALDATRMRIDPLGAEPEPEEALREDVAPEPDHVVCPKCGGEYRLEILRCPDCDVDLKTVPVERPAAEEPEEFYHELPTEDEIKSAFVMPTPPRHEIPASDDLVCLCCGALSELAVLWPALDNAGIGHRIEIAPHPRSAADCCLYLSPEDCDAAERIWKALGPKTQSVAPEEGTCPSCGTQTQAPDCPACGLGLTIPADVSCSHCGAIVIGPLTRCPNCGGDTAARP